MDGVTPGFHALAELPFVELILLLGIPAYWFLGLAVFSLRCALGGMPRTERIGKTGSRVVPRFILEFGWWMLRLPLWVLMRLGVTADMVSWLSLVLAAAAGLGFGLGRFGLGGWLLAASAAFDSLDGTLARETGTASERGEYFDAIVDRYSDFFVSFGLLYYYRNDALPAGLVALGIVGSQVMGYAKAKGEAVGIDPKVGWMQRHERCLYLVVGTIFAPLVAAFVEPQAPHPQFHLTLVALAAIALFTNLAAVRRAHYVLARMVRVERPEAGRPATSQAAAQPISQSETAA